MPEKNGDEEVGYELVYPYGACIAMLIMTGDLRFILHSVIRKQDYL